MVFDSAKKERWIVAARKKDVEISRYIDIYKFKEFQEFYKPAGLIDF